MVWNAKNTLEYVLTLEAEVKNLRAFKACVTELLAKYNTEELISAVEDQP